MMMKQMEFKFKIAQEMIDDLRAENKEIKRQLRDVQAHVKFERMKKWFTVSPPKNKAMLGNIPVVVEGLNPGGKKQQALVMFINQKGKQVEQIVNVDKLKFD